MNRVRPPRPPPSAQPLLGDTISGELAQGDAASRYDAREMGQRRQYVVSGSGPDENFSFIAPSEEDLRNWLDSEHVVGSVPRIRDSILEDLRDRGEASYDAQSLDDFELGDDEYEDLLDGRFDIYIHTIELTEAQEVLQALHEINRHRGKVGQRPLDPVDAGWGPEDVIAEAQRLQRARNAAQLKRRLM